jgi:glycosyltransferase involved in cell wall biosynthesis
MAKAGALARTAAWNLNVPVIIHTFHGHVLDGYFSKPATSAFLRIERLLAKRTDALVAVSPIVRDELLELGVGSPGQWHVVPLGLDLESIDQVVVDSQQARKRLGLPRHGPLVGIVGRLVSIKNHDLFFTAAKRIAAAIPDAHFIVAGDGELRSALEPRARASLGNRVHFLGWVTEMPILYRALDVVALTSRNEGTPVALIEAAAASTPTVATDVGGVRDVIDQGRTGYIVPANDAGSIADRVIELLQAPHLRQRMGTEANSRALTRFGAQRSLDEVARLYESLLSDNKPFSPKEGKPYLNKGAMKIAVLVPDLRTGGAERLLVDFASILRDREEDVSLDVLGLRDGSIREELEAVGCTVTVVRSTGRVDPAAIIRLRRELRRIKPSLVHAHLPRAGIFGRIASLGSSTPLVYTEHSSWEQHHLLTRILNQRTYHLNTAVVAISEMVRTSLLNRTSFPANRIVTIRNGVAPYTEHLSRHEAAERMYLPTDALIIGCTANLMPRKGQALLLEAFAKLDAVGALYCVLIGRDEGAEKELRLLAHRLGIADRCRFLGFRADARSLLAAIDIFVLPSWLEGLPVALLEAMEAGRAVVATSVGGIPEVLIHEETGLLVQPGDSAQLAAALRTLAQNDAVRKRLGEAARNKILNEYSANVFVDKHLALYEALLP